MQKAKIPIWYSVPEFIDVRYEFGELLDSRYVVLTATLSSDAGIEKSGFLIGYNEAKMSFINADVNECRLSTTIYNLLPETDYCFYAIVGNGNNEIRTKLIQFSTPKTGDTTPPVIIPDNPIGSGIVISDSNFRDYLLGICDFDKNGEISSDEADSVKTITVCTDSIMTLDGVQYFRELKSLDCQGSVWKGKLKALALQDNNKLERLNFSYNHVRDFALPSSLIELTCRFNDMPAPDFSSVPNLKKLDCFGAGITNLDVSKLNELEELTCGYNAFETLDVSSNLKLKYLDVSDSPSLKTVYVAKGQKIQEIKAANSVDIKYRD
jgi:hypothetical protein